jgi:hypothetical protein
MTMFDGVNWNRCWSRLLLLSDCSKAITDSLRNTWF